MEKYKFINYEINKEKKCCLKRIGRQKKNENWEIYRQRQN